MISEICTNLIKQKYGSQINQLKKLRLLQEININLQSLRKSNLQALFRWADQLDKDGYKVYVDSDETKQYIQGSGFIPELASNDVKVI
ncbi:hypothetical protein [Mycoplasmopsis cynos]|uniref:hypothetical protein n=1 Tax=Mycoplasmopsis cynos TaxID=171284 RepID=UPI0024CA01A4|nr:hypothetical protein [Mycoplasmopsis cynos]WAM07655.1 hypothetical protein ONA21_06040 [Mycoplasmopsis cynos]